jgi:hypothetical protein
MAPSGKPRGAKLKVKRQGPAGASWIQVIERLSPSAVSTRGSVGWVAVGVGDVGTVGVGLIGVGRGSVGDAVAVGDTGGTGVAVRSAGQIVNP